MVGRCILRVAKLGGVPTGNLEADRLKSGGLVNPPESSRMDNGEDKME
jgi:hypothetical protein